MFKKKGSIKSSMPRVDAAIDENYKISICKVDNSYNDMSSGYFLHATSPKCSSQ